jgi:hypothetical protein
VAARGLMPPRMCGKPVFQFDTPRMPTAWWLRPVRRHARVGEHSAVVWNPVYRNPPAASASMCGVASVDP